MQINLSTIHQFSGQGSLTQETQQDRRQQRLKYFLLESHGKSNPKLIYFSF